MSNVHHPTRTTSAVHLATAIKRMREAQTLRALAEVKDQVKPRLLARDCDALRVAYEQNQQRLRDARIDNY